MPFSPDEVVEGRHLSPVQYATVRGVKGARNALKKSGAAPALDKLKSCHIKRAVPWLAHDRPSDRCTGGRHMVLGWLQDRLSTGHLPCFCWPDINLVRELSPAEWRELIWAVRRDV